MVNGSGLMDRRSSSKIGTEGSQIAGDGRTVSVSAMEDGMTGRVMVIFTISASVDALTTELVPLFPEEYDQQAKSTRIS